MWLYTGVIFSVLFLLTAYKLTDLQEILQGCHPGDITENEYNKCICTPSYIFECFSKQYNDTDNPDTKEKPTCYPDMIYALDSVTCICGKDGFWPHYKCENIFKSFPNNLTEGKTCEPNTYTINGCNVCKCGPNGFIDRKHCTKNKCNKINVTKTRRFSMKENHVYGNCKTKSWYSFAPCQFCYCINENKLVCNTGGTYTKKLQLGSYNLSVCGEELITDAMSLVPETQKQNFLREGYKELQKGKHLTTTDNTIIDEAKHVSFEINQVENNEETFHKKSVEYYSNSEESSQTETPTISYTNDRPEGSTTFPYQDGEDISDKDSLNQSEETMEVTGFDVLTSTKPEIRYQEYNDPNKSQKQNVLRENAKDNDKKYTIRDVIQPYVPFVLDKVFKMALSNSFSYVTVYNETCTPDTQSYKNCNQCFCFKKYTLVCTNFVCESVKNYDE